MMKMHDGSLHFFSQSLFIVAALLGWVTAGLFGEAFAIPLTGTNGRTVDFAGIKSAGPGGLEVQVKEGDPVIEIGWDRLDLEKIKTQHPGIAAAYQKSLAGETTALDLGTFAPKPKEMVFTGREKPSLKEFGFFRASVSGSPEAGFDTADFAVILPKNTDPRGILLLSIGRDGNSINYVNTRPGMGPWGSYQTDFDFAIVGADFARRSAGGGEPDKAPGFIFPEKGSGDALLAALDTLSEQSGKKLTDLPIAVYGQSVLGAAFAFNFTQWKPERVVAAVVGKGAYYATPPTVESVKVPLLMIWGEYNREPENAQATHSHAEIFGNNVKLKPNWIYAMEPRGQADESPQSFYFAKTFLVKMIESRLSDEGLVEWDRSGSWVGDLKAFTVSPSEDPEASLTATQTWLPDEELAQMWEQFVNGRLQPEP